MKNVDLEEICKLTDGFTGADLENLCREVRVVLKIIVKNITILRFE